MAGVESGCPGWVIRDRVASAANLAMSVMPPKAAVKQALGIRRYGPLRVDGAARDVIQAPKPEPRIMRYQLSDYEWTAIKPMLPNKPRGVRRVNDRRVLNGIFWVLRSGAPWRDLPENYGPRTTCVTIASFGGGGLASGTRSSMHWPPVTTRRCK